MVTGCQITGDDKRKYGLYNNHWYTLMDVVDVKDGDADVTLVKLREPFGEDRYTGPWKRSDDTKWTKENKDLVSLDD